MDRIRFGAAAVALTFYLPAEIVSAGAFQLREGSATALGAALAGRTANDSDVSLAIQNPAAMRGVEHFQVSGGLTYLFAKGDAEVPVTIPGFSSTDDPNEDAVVPSFAIGYRATPDIVVGLTVDAPFGLATEYGSNFVGAFDGIRTELTTIAVTPIISWDVTPRVTLAGGISLQYADAMLESLAPVAPGPVLGKVDVSGDGFEVGYSLGAIFEPFDGTKLGMHYHSGYSYRLKGGFSNPYFIPALSGQKGTAEFNLPAIASIGLIQSITPDFRVMAEAEWTGWDAYETISIAGVGSEAQNYKDSYMVSVGAEYDVNDRLTLRGGWAYDQTPTTDAYRTTRTPDNDKMWFAAGASYDITDTIGIDLAYMYLLAKDSTVRLRNGPAAGTTVNYTNPSIHLFAANLRYTF